MRNYTCIFIGSYCVPMPVVSVTKTFAFEAAHVLPWHPGKCSRLHGHSYRLDVTVTGPTDGNGVVIDFADLGRAVRAAVVERCDHALLNDLVDNPTAENLAAAFLDWLSDAGLAASELTVWETATSRATVRP